MRFLHHSDLQSTDLKESESTKNNCADSIFRSSPKTGFFLQTIMVRNKSYNRWTVASKWTEIWKDVEFRVRVFFLFFFVQFSLFYRLSARFRICSVIPDGKFASILLGKTTKGFVLFCWFLISPVAATEMTIGDSCCRSSSDKLIAVNTVKNHIKKNVRLSLRSIDQWYEV